jgi:hypothetical protein
MKTYDVYGTENKSLYSEGVTRWFGVNRYVKLDDGEIVLSSVQPLANLSPDAAEKGYVRKIGIIMNKD